MRELLLLSVLVLACGGLAGRTRSRPKTSIRTILADQLRDYPGLCFASTKCATFQPGEKWDLTPFCGQSTCAVAEDGRLVEVVEDCGPIPKKEAKCKLNEAKTNSTAPFPHCCPVFDCEEGYQPEDSEEATEPTTSRSGRRNSARRRGRGRDL